MRLFVRTAFWLSVTIYYLPSPTEHLVPRALPHRIERPSIESSSAESRHVSLGAYNRGGKCRQTLARGAEQGLRASNNILLRSQDTLTPSDLAIPWRGRAPFKAFKASSICNTVARK
jgi:hypothetical protein